MNKQEGQGESLEEHLRSLLDRARAATVELREARREKLDLQHKCSALRAVPAVFVSEILKREFREAEAALALAGDNESAVITKLRGVAGEVRAALSRDRDETSMAQQRMGCKLTEHLCRAVGLAKEIGALGGRHATAVGGFNAALQAGLNSQVFEAGLFEPVNPAPPHGALPTNELRELYRRVGGLFGEPAKEG